MIRTAGFDLPPKLLSDTRASGIKKLRFFGLARIEWRPMLCEGPIGDESAATLLLGAHEKGWELVPPDADHQAAELKEKVKANPSARRRPHERAK